MSRHEGVISNLSVERYMAGLRSDTDPVLTEMERLADDRGFPIVGSQVGRLLAVLAVAGGARRVLELGSGFGYSAVWFARAVGAEGRVECTDADPANRETAFRFFDRAGLSGRVVWHTGNALRAAAGLDGPFDLVFCDIDKESYPEAIGPAARLLRPGGLFIVDNALWYGRVADPSADDLATRGVRRFNLMLAADRRFASTIVPLRDGVALAVRTEEDP